METTAVSSSERQARYEARRASVRVEFQQLAAEGAFKAPEGHAPEPQQHLQLETALAVDAAQEGGV